MNIQTCKFVPVSEIILPDDPGRTELYDHLSETQDWSWGSNNRTLINRDDFYNALDDASDDVSFPVAILDRAEAVPQGVYIDLEN